MMPGVERHFQIAQTLKRRLETAIIGRKEAIDLVVIAFLADGHVLLEDYPGSGKTTLARALGGAVTDESTRTPEGPSMAAFRRIQFTPDLLPSDITGTSVFDVQTSTFAFRPGPLFAHVVLADEINRTSPKVQAAMLEAMAEKQVTVDNQTYPLDELFCVIATQNPLDVSGTYPLPTPQLDRFLFKIRMTFIDPASELAVLERYPHTSLEAAEQVGTVRRDDVVAARQWLRQHVRIAPPIKDGLVRFANRLRQDSRVLQGTSTRSLLLALSSMQARALLQGRDYVTPDDLERLAPYLFAHRMECSSEVQEASAVVSECLRPTLEALSKVDPAAA
jgi:MoxR-like ATPase